MDNYTKGVLTIIAVALVSISFQLSQTDVIEKAHAVGEMSVNVCSVTGYNCAGIYKDPTGYTQALKVYIVNESLKIHNHR